MCRQVHIGVGRGSLGSDPASCLKRLAQPHRGLLAATSWMSCICLTTIWRQGNLPEHAVSKNLLLFLMAPSIRGLPWWEFAESPFRTFLELNPSIGMTVFIAQAGQGMVSILDSSWPWPSSLNLHSTTFHLPLGKEFGLNHAFWF